MQKPIWLYLLVAIYSLGLMSCDNELNVAADWKETAIVYGLLNPTDEKQYIRIQRTYLDEERGAMLFSSEPDSLYFDSLDVTITEFVNGNFAQTFTLRKVDGNAIGLPKDSGIFGVEHNYLYELSEPVQMSNFFNDYSYVLNVVNPQTGYSLSSNTINLGNAEMTSPVSPVYNEIFLSSVENHAIVVKYQEGKHARSYDLVMDIHIEEVLKADTNVRSQRVVRWKMMTENETQSLSGYNSERKIVRSASFFNTLGAQLSVDTAIFRRLLGYDLMLYGSGEELMTYVNVNKPSIGIVQKKPEYTNVSNGLGLFSSRHINRFMNGKFAPDSYGHLQLSEETQDLGFVRY